VRAKLFGNKKRFAAEVGNFYKGSPQLRRVDLWAAERRLTRQDNMVFLPQFCGDVENAIEKLQSGHDFSLPFPGLSPEETYRHIRNLDDDSRERFESFWFLRWGPTTDAISPYVFRTGARLSITFEFHRETHPIPEERNVIFVADVLETEFIGVLKQMLTTLKSDLIS
jgi:hypothetical protein